MKTCCDDEATAPIGKDKGKCGKAKNASLLGKATAEGTNSAKKYQKLALVSNQLGGTAEKEVVTQALNAVTPNVVIGKVDCAGPRPEDGKKACPPKLNSEITKQPGAA